MSQRNHIQNDASQQNDGGGILGALFGPLIGMLLVGLLGVLVFGSIILAMMGASVMGIEVTGGMGWAALLVGAIVIHVIVNA